MQSYGQRQGFPPGFNTWPDFQKLSWYTEEFDDKLSEIQSLNNHIRALQQKEQDALQDAYEFQDKAKDLEKKYEEVKHQMDRFSTGLPREVMLLKQTVKKEEKEIMLLQVAVAKRDESIQKLRARLISAKEEYKTEIKLLDDIIDERNIEVNQLRENELELKADIQALDSCCKFEKQRIDELKIAAEKYDEAGPTLERLNTILAKYLGDQLQDGLDWPPGHPDNKTNMNRALDALENELRKASLKPTPSVLPTPTTVSKPQREVNNPGRRNRANSGGSDVSFCRPPTFLAPGQRRCSDTNTTLNSVPPNTNKNLGAELRLHSDLSDGEADLYDSRSPISSQYSGSATLEKKKSFGSLVDRAAEILEKDLEDFDEEISMDVRDQSPTSFSPSPFNFSCNELARTPTNGKKRPDLGPRTSTDQGNSNHRNISMFGNSTALPEDDSPKPSDKIFADDRKKQRGLHFTNKPTPIPEPIIEYRDKIVYKDKIVKVPVLMQCTKAHVEDQLLVKPDIMETEKVVIQEVKIPCYLNHVKDQPPQESIIKEKKIMVPCSRDHLSDHTCATKEVEKKVMVPCSRDHVADHICPTKEVKVPCCLDHCKDHSALKSKEINKDVEAIEKVSIQCTKPHAEGQPSQEPKVVYQDRKIMVPCSRSHLEDHVCTPAKEVIKGRKVNVPCSKDHVENIPGIEPKVVTKEIKIPVPCSKPHVDQHTRLANVIEKIVERPVEVFVDRPIIQEKIVKKYINTTVYGPRNPLWTIGYIYFDLLTILIYYLNQQNAYGRTVANKFNSYFPGKLQNWCLTDPLAGRTFEVIDSADHFKTEKNARTALLKKTINPVEQIETKIKAQVPLDEQMAKNAANNHPSHLRLSEGKARGTDTTATVPLHKRKPTSSSPHFTGEDNLSSAKSSHSDEDEYVLVTQYVIRRPPLVSNLLMAFLFTAFFVVFFLAGCVVREYSSLLKLQGVIRPGWFTQPWVSQGVWCRRGGATLRSGFVVDSDWSWVRYFWEAVARLGWLRQVHFWLERTASGGAGYRMPG